MDGRPWVLIRLALLRGLGTRGLEDFGHSDCAVANAGFEKWHGDVTDLENILLTSIHGK